MAKPSNSYEMIKWTPFQRQKPELGHPIIVFSTELGVVEAVLEADGLNTGGVSGHFTHWADRIRGPSSAQLWIDWAISWVK